MNTHLSEASVNSLLTLVKGAKTSRSYADKINILTKAGILHGGQKYSSRLEPGVEVPSVQEVVPEVASGSEPGERQRLLSRVKLAYLEMEIVKKVISMAKGFYLGTSEDFKRRLIPCLSTPGIPGYKIFDNAINAAIEKLEKDASSEEKGTYNETCGKIKQNGAAGQFALLKIASTDALIELEVQTQLKKQLEEYAIFGVRAEDIINEGPNYLSTISDGTYSFTVNQVNTTQPDIITGTAVITSQKDRYTGRLEQKLINNTIIGAVPITALQTLDAYYNSIQVDTSGSSYNGKYTVTGNTATITSNGYSQAAGEFVETVTTIISSIFSFSFYVINSIINPDKSQTIISLTIYTRQLKSAEITQAIADAFKVVDTDGDGFLTRGQAVEAGKRLAALNPGQFKFDPAGLNPVERITRERFEGAFDRVNRWAGPY